MSRARDTAGIIQYNQISFDSNNAVGIGSSIPDTKLDVNGGMRVTGIGTFENDVQIADKIVHTGDTNTAIRFPAADTFSVETSGGEALRVDSSKRLVVGADASVQVAGSHPFVQHHGNKTTTNLAVAGYANNSGGSILALGASRSTTVGTPGTVVSNNDILGDIRFAGDDGTDINSIAAAIRGEVDGAPGSNDMPGRLVFATTADGAASATERLRITSAGEVIVNGTAAGSNAKFEVQSTTGSIASATLRVSGEKTTTGAINTGSTIILAGHDGGNSRDFASFFAGKENGTGSNFDAYLAFGTRSNGNTLAERLRITSAGLVSIQNDSGKFTCGASDDLEIYHNGTFSYIDSKSTQLRIETDAIRLRTDSGETMIEGDANADVKIYYDNSKRIQTTSDGVDFFGVGSIKVPVGTTAERPTGVAGDFRYNSTTGGFEGYTTEWGAIAGGGGGGITSAFSSPSGITTHVFLSDAQEHKFTCSGITTISCVGGVEGESHTIRIINSGITTVGFSTFFLFPSGAAPSLPTADGAISLISFTVNRVGAAGTQLLAGASVNFS